MYSGLNIILTPADLELCNWIQSSVCTGTYNLKNNNTYLKLNTNSHACINSPSIQPLLLCDYIFCLYWPITGPMQNIDHKL